ncbi:hypothetical protein [uncultured Shewanella sp.]|uniref:hypothetical protein n=1 Tax=uncultured Shewanella sp. TaxID=173975 RepID=UPI00261D3B4A|nr:hypothetical protein [uncultured Shewanella sp.]
MSEKNKLTPQKPPAEAYCQHFMPSSRMIENVDTQLQTLTVNQHCKLPMSLNNTEFHNSYVCSPYTAFIPYCLEELDKLNKPWLEALIRPCIRLLGYYLKKNKVNKVLHVNNWLLSTNLYPNSFHSDAIDELTKTLIKDYSEHTIIFRSLNSYSNPELIQGFKQAGYILAPSRQVYIYDKKLNDYQQRRDYKNDLNLIKKTPYQRVDQAEITPNDYPRIIELYNMLYISKYSQLNPQFTETYLETVFTHPHFSFEGYRNAQGTLDAIAGRFSIDGIVTSPIIGYDITQPKKLGLYRLAAFSGLDFAQKNQKIFNASSGAAHFKRQRGGQAFIEYSAIYTRHLPKKTQRMWQVLSWITNNVFVPLIKKHQL